MRLVVWRDEFFQPDEQVTTYAEVGIAPDHGQVTAVESLMGLDTGLIAVVIAAQGLLGLLCWVAIPSSSAPDSVRVMLCRSCLPSVQ